MELISIILIESKKALLKPLFRHSDQFMLFSLRPGSQKIWLFCFFFLGKIQGRDLYSSFGN